MAYSGILRHVALVRTDVSEEISASIIRVTRIGELGTSVLTRATQRNIPEDGILHRHRRENLKSYIALSGWTLKQRRNVSPVKYEMRFYIPEDDILHSHRRENLKSYRALAGWTM
jgi:hypothetical protein